MFLTLKFETIENARSKLIKRIVTFRVCKNSHTVDFDMFIVEYYQFKGK